MLNGKNLQKKQREELRTFFPRMFSGLLLQKKVEFTSTCIPHIYRKQVLSKFSPLNGYGLFLFLNCKIISISDQMWRRGGGEEGGREDIQLFHQCLTVFYSHIGGYRACNSCSRSTSSTPELHAWKKLLLGEPLGCMGRKPIQLGRKPIQLLAEDSH